MQKKIMILMLSILLLCNIALIADSSGDKENSKTYIIIATVVSLGLLGLFFGGGLGIASKVFEVKTDPKVEKIDAILPQAQCGMCGCPGCSKFAEAVAKGDAQPDACKPGGPELAKQIGDILGIKVETKVAPVATILCTRKDQVKKTKDYRGIKDCKAAVALGENIYECAFACLGFGTCANICPFDAIYMDEKTNMPVIIEDTCTGCGLCAQECPVNVIGMTPRDKHVHILCVSTEPPKIKGKVHKPGACIGCRKCVKKCPENAIAVVNNVAKIDYDKCTNCETCISVCPTTAIFNIRPQKKDQKEEENTN